MSYDAKQINSIVTVRINFTHVSSRILIKLGRLNDLVETINYSKLMVLSAAAVTGSQLRSVASIHRSISSSPFDSSSIVV